MVFYNYSLKRTTQFCIQHRSIRVSCFFFSLTELAVHCKIEILNMEHQQLNMRHCKLSTLSINLCFRLKLSILNMFYIKICCQLLNFKIKYLKLYCDEWVITFNLKLRLTDISHLRHGGKVYEYFILSILFEQIGKHVTKTLQKDCIILTNK